MNKVFSLDLALLKQELNNNAYLTTMKHIKVGKEFVVNGTVYVKCPEIYGHKYNFRTHSEELQPYNCKYVEAGEYTCYAYFPEDATVIVRTEE